MRKATRRETEHGQWLSVKKWVCCRFKREKVVGDIGSGDYGGVARGEREFSGKE